MSRAGSGSYSAKVKPWGFCAKSWQLQGTIPREDQLLGVMAGLAADGYLPGAWLDIVAAVELAGETNPANVAGELSSYHTGAVNIVGLPRIAQAVDALAAALMDRVTLESSEAEPVILTGLVTPVGRTKRRSPRRAKRNGSSGAGVFDEV